MASREPLIQYETSGGIAVIRLNDPPANAYSYEMNRALEEIAGPELEWYEQLAADSSD